MKYYCHGIQTLYDTCTYLKVPLQFSPAEGAVCKDFVLCCEYKCDLYLNQLVYSQCCDPHKDTLPGLITGSGHNLEYEKQTFLYSAACRETQTNEKVICLSNDQLIPAQTNDHSSVVKPVSPLFSEGVVRDIYPPPAHLSSD